MDAVRLDGNLQQLAAMVRGTNRRQDPVASPANPVPTAELQATSSNSGSLPDSTRKIANGLSKEEAEPLREERDVDAHLEELALQIDANPSLAIMAQGGVRQGTVLALV